MNMHGEAKSSMTLTMRASQGACESMMETVCCLLQYPLHPFPVVLAPQFLAGPTAEIKDYISQLPWQVKTRFRPLSCKWKTHVGL